MGKSFEVNINPDAVKFAIESSGYSIRGIAEELSKRAKIKRLNYRYLKEVIEGKKKPLYTDLKYLDSLVKRGIPFFFLNKIPEENVLPMFRKKHANVKLNPDTEIKLREYEELRNEIKYLLDEENVEFKRKLKIYSVEDNPKEVAGYIREIFSFNDIDIKRSKVKDVFEHIRRSIEANNIFVFKNSLENSLRGCIFLNDRLPPLILINSNDDKNAEIFSLLHEFAHYLLNDEELDIEEGIAHDKNTEKWCNRFAYHFMIPEEVEKREGFNRNNKELLLDKENIRRISKEYKVSKHSLMFRFFNLRIISKEEYTDFLKRNPFKAKSKKSSSGSGGDYYNTQRDRLSRKYIGLVFNNYTDGNISITDTFSYLGVKDFDRVNQFMEVVDNG